MKNPKILFYRNPSMGACPECGTVGMLKKSRSRNLWEQLSKKLTPYKYYRCRSCGWRGKLSTYTFTKESVKSIFFYLVLMAVSVFIIKTVIEKLLLR